MQTVLSVCSNSCYKLAKTVSANRMIPIINEVGCFFRARELLGSAAFSAAATVAADTCGSSRTHCADWVVAFTETVSVNGSLAIQYDGQRTVVEK
jgi:hypothetical protein